MVAVAFCFLFVTYRIDACHRSPSYLMTYNIQQPQGKSKKRKRKKKKNIFGQEIYSSDEESDEDEDQYQDEDIPYSKQQQQGKYKAATEKLKVAVRFKLEKIRNGSYTHDKSSEIIIEINCPEVSHLH